MGNNKENLDADLDLMSADELKAETIKVRNAIRKSLGRELHELCHRDPDLESVLPEAIDQITRIPRREQFEEGCRIYQEMLYGKKLLNIVIVDAPYQPEQG